MRLKRRDLSMGGAIFLEGDVVTCDEYLWNTDSFRFMEKVEYCAIGMDDDPK